MARFVDKLNNVLLDSNVLALQDDDAPTLTFSYFLPYIKLIPNKKYLTIPFICALDPSSSRRGYVS